MDGNPVQMKCAHTVWKFCLYPRGQRLPTHGDAAQERKEKRGGLVSVVLTNIEYHIPLRSDGQI